jgi:hypothetical protein
MGFTNLGRAGEEDGGLNKANGVKRPVSINSCDI